MSNVLSVPAPYVWVCTLPDSRSLLCDGCQRARSPPEHSQIALIHDNHPTTAKLYQEFGTAPTSHAEPAQTVRCY